MTSLKEQFNICYTLDPDIALDYLLFVCDRMDGDCNYCGWQDGEHAPGCPHQTEESNE